jgi:hypothetical protein
MTAPIASGWSDCRVGLAPTGKRRLCTAHANTGLLLPFSFDQLIGCDENGLWYGKAILQAIDMPDGEPLNLAS